MKRVIRNYVSEPSFGKRKKSEEVRYDLQEVKILKLVQDDRLYSSPDLGRENEIFAS